MNATLQRTQVEKPKIVSRAEWLEARKRLGQREREVAKLCDELNAERRMLPWVKVEKEYVFDGPGGKVTLSKLFNGRSQLFIKHFMMGPGQKNQCVGCSLEVDHLAGLLPHLENHDVSYVAVARAPFDEIEALCKRMDWHFPWVSSFHNDFNYDFNVSFKPEEMAAGTATYNYKQGNPGMEDLSGDSVFYKNGKGEIFHTYSVFGRGAEMFLGIYAFFDVMPKGRNEQGPYHSLTDWARPHNLYGKGGTVEANGRYHASGCACSAHG
jgi:predicted dithiol-disulfide oxidoreductase (DUF899 family)